jgi:hypothetical protein
MTKIRRNEMNTNLKIAAAVVAVVGLVVNSGAVSLASVNSAPQAAAHWNDKAPGGGTSQILHIKGNSITVAELQQIVGLVNDAGANVQASGTFQILSVKGSRMSVAELLKIVGAAS